MPECMTKPPRPDKTPPPAEPYRSDSDIADQVRTAIRNLNGALKSASDRDIHVSFRVSGTSVLEICEIEIEKREAL